MKLYNYAQLDEHIQWLIEMMNREYPNNYELVIDSVGANIRSTQSDMTFLRKDLKDNKKEPILGEYLKNLKVGTYD